MPDLLTDERPVRVRPIQAQDERALHAFFLALSPQTLRLRFHHDKGTLDGALVRYYTHVDHDRHLAFVAEAEDAIVGEVRCIAHPGGESCELGIVVADAWRHTGLAQRLMGALEAAARARGYRRIEGLVLAENRDMLDFVRELGFEADPCPEEPARVRVTKRL